MPALLRHLQLVAVFALLTLSITTTAAAELTPDWAARLPVGSSISAGIAGFAVDDAGVSYLTSVDGPSFNNDVRTAAYLPDGTLLWSQGWNGPEDSHDQARGIALGPAGVVWVTGNTPASNGFSNVLLLKYDAFTGTLLDTIQFSSGFGISEHGASVTTDAAGNVYVAGGTVGDGGDGLILKFGPNGNLVWKRTWDGPASAPFSNDEAEQILMAPDGNPVVRLVGVMASQHADFVVVKYAAGDGATIWETTWGEFGEDSATDMTIDDLGDLYVTGVGFDLIVKISTIRLRGTDGALLWQAYDSVGFDHSSNGIVLDGAGGVFITGSSDPDGDDSNFNDDFYTIRRDADSGAQVWTHRFGSACIDCFDKPSDVTVDPAGNLFVLGHTSSPPYDDFRSHVILFNLDSATGIELDRGVVTDVGSGQLRFDSAYRLYNGGQFLDVNFGGVDLTLLRYPSLVADLYALETNGFVAGAEVTITLTGATPGETQLIAYSLTGLGSTPLPQLGTELDLEAPRLMTSGVADASGAFAATFTVPAAAAGKRIWLQSVESGRVSTVDLEIVR